MKGQSRAQCLEILKSEAKKLLGEKRVERVIGYRRGTLPLRAVPHFVRSVADLDALVWDPSCENNLALYLPRFKGKKTAIVAKGCDAKAIVGLLHERQIVRDDIVVLGIPCEGVVDRRKLASKVGTHDVRHTQYNEEDVKLHLGAQKNKAKVPLREILFDACVVCQVRNPKLFDVLLGEEVELPQGEDPYANVAEMAAKSPDERWAYFESEMSRCITCYACRNVCPLCYCNECFIDSTRPRWASRSERSADVYFYHLSRLMHMAGRCVDCGACGRACPMGIDLRRYLNKVRYDVKEFFGVEAGLRLEDPCPMETFSEADPNAFVR